MCQARLRCQGDERRCCPLLGERAYHIAHFLSFGRESRGVALGAAAQFVLDMQQCCEKERRSRQTGLVKSTTDGCVLVRCRHMWVKYVR